MKKWIVEVREVWIQPKRVEAESEAEAVRKVKKGDGEPIDEGFEYSHTLDPEYWTISEDEQQEGAGHG